MISKAWTLSSERTNGLYLLRVTMSYILQETISGNPGFDGALPVSDFISASTTTVPISEFSQVSSNPNGITSVTFYPDLSGGGCADFSSVLKVLQNR
jgi:hypothetical protein